MKKTPITARVLALACVLLALVSFLFLLPQSLIISYLDTKNAILGLAVNPEGTASFVEDSHHRIVVGVATLVLDTLGCVGMWCIIGIVFNLLSRPWQLFSWTIAFMTGFGSAVLRCRLIGPTTEHMFVFLVIIAPLIIGALSVLGLILTLFDRNLAKV